MESTDVLVIGSGIAGLCAAIEAARTGATVAVASAGKTMSGSSFFPGTWGLGLIGPVDEGDEQDLIDTIQTVGGGVADLELVQTVVHGIPQAIEWLEQDLGVELQRPQSAESAQQKQFIPCFDHKTRMWRGLTRKPLEDALTARLVIQQQEIVALGVSNAKVHELGEIEFVLPSYKTNDVRIFCLQLIVIIERLLFCAVVFDYDKLEIVVR